MIISVFKLFTALKYFKKANHFLEHSNLTPLKIYFYYILFWSLFQPLRKSLNPK